MCVEVLIMRSDAMRDNSVNNMIHVSGCCLPAVLTTAASLVILAPISMLHEFCSWALCCFVALCSVVFLAGVFGIGCLKLFLLAAVFHEYRMKLLVSSVDFQ